MLRFNKKLKEEEGWQKQKWFCITTILRVLLVYMRDFVMSAVLSLICKASAFTSTVPHVITLY